MRRLDGRVLGDPVQVEAPGELTRQRLIDHLAQRWQVNLVTVAAAAGYGKSTALSQAIRDNSSDPSGQDVVIRCAADYATPLRVLQSLLAALDGPPRSSVDTPERCIRSLVAAVASASPNHVCLILDDVHHLDNELTGEILLDLMEALPANGHLVLAGRWLPELDPVRLAGLSITSITRTDLSFDTAEMDRLADELSLTVDALEAISNWPATVGLSGNSGAQRNATELVREVLDQMNEDTAVALTAVTLGQRVNDEMLRSVGIADHTTATLLQSVPLLVDYGDGWIGPHDIWTEAQDQLLAVQACAEIQPAVLSWLLTGSDPDAAIRLAATIQSWDAALRGIMAGLNRDSPSVPAAQLEHWHELIPSRFATRPEMLALSSRIERKRSGPKAGFEDCRLAMEAFRETGQVDDEVEMLADYFARSWESGEPAGIMEIFGRVEELVESGATRLVPLQLTAMTGMYDLSGKPEDALELLAQMPHPGVGANWQWRDRIWQITLSLLVGRGEDALRYLDQLEQVMAPSAFAPQALMTTWLTGDPSWLRAGDFLANPPTSHKPFDRDGFLSRIYGSGIAASLGLVIPTEDLTAMTGHARDVAFCAVAQATTCIAQGNDAAAQDRLARYFDEVEPSVDLGFNEIRRFLPITYVLSPTVRARVDQQAESGTLGPLHVRRRQLARLFLSARESSTADWDQFDEAETFTAFPLRWSMELAARAEHADHEFGQRLTDYLIDWTGATGRDVLRHLAESDDPAVASGAAQLIRRIPTPPDHTLRIHALGQLRCTSLDRSEPAPDLKRTRVRQLLGLIILRGGVVTREDAVGLLWKDKKREAAQNNLRVTLSYLRRVLEPQRRKSEAHYHLREHERDLSLRDSELLNIDVNEVRTALADARLAEAKNELGLALKHYGLLLELVHELPFPDLRGIDELQLELADLDRQLIDGLSRLGELALAESETLLAATAADRVLQLDPYSERAHRILIGTALDEQDINLAQERAAACRALLLELDVEPVLETRMVLRRLQLRVQHSPVSPPQD